MSDENKKDDFNEKLVGDYWKDYCSKRDKIEDEMVNAWYEYTRKIEDAQKRLYDLKKTDGKKYDGTRFEDDVKNHAPFLKVLSGDGLMPVEGAEKITTAVKITKAVDEAFPKIFDEVSRKLKRLGEDMAARSAEHLTSFAMYLPEMESFSWHLFYLEYGSDDYCDKIIEYAKASRFAAVRSSYNLALTCKTPDPHIVEDCERQLGRLDDDSLDKTYYSSADGERIVDRQVRAGAAGAVLDFIAEWRLREHFTEWVRDGRPDKSLGSEKGDKGDDLSK